MSHRNHRPPSVLPLVALVALFLAPLAVPSQNTAQDLFATGEQQLRDGRTSYNVAILTQARATFATCIQHNQAPATDRCYYNLARTDHYLNLAEQNGGHTRAAKDWLNTALTDAQIAVAHNPRSADAHALLGDIYGAEIDGMLSGMKYGPKANTEIEEALRLDRHSALSWAVLGRKYLYAPSLFGGDIEKAIDAFNEACLYDPGSDEDFVWLAIALQKKGYLPKARQAVMEALRLNSRSVFAQHEEAALL